MASSSASILTSFCAVNQATRGSHSTRSSCSGRPTQVKRPRLSSRRLHSRLAVTRDDFIGKTVVMGGNSFLYTYRHEEIGENRAAIRVWLTRFLGHISPYMIIYHDCDPQVVRHRRPPSRLVAFHGIFSGLRTMLCANARHTRRARGARPHRLPQHRPAQSRQ